MKKLFITLALGIFLISFASAGYSSYDYSHPDEIVLRKTITLHEDRFSTYDYRHGYTYRATEEYKDRRYDRDYKRQSGYHTEYDFVRSSKNSNRHYYQDYDSSDDGYYWTYDGATGTHYRFSDFDNSRGRSSVIRLSSSSRDYDRHSNYRYRDFDSLQKRDYRYDIDYRRSGVGVKREYVSHLRTYEEKDCYVIPPRGVLFYRKC